MILSYKEKRPDIHPDAYVAPNAVIRGNVQIAKGCSVLFGAVVTAEGGSVSIGADCVIMEQAVLRGTPKHPLHIGHSSLVGPHAHLSGCRLGKEVFIATGASIFNGAEVRDGSEVRINGTVHVNSVLEQGSTVPIAWIAVGHPAEVFPPKEHGKIWKRQKEMDFPGTVWGVERTVSQGARIRTYAKALQRHRRDEIISK